MSRRQYAPALAGKPDSTKLVKHKLNDLDESNEEYNASTFGGFSDYMRRKKLKLQNQDALLRSRVAEDTPAIFAGMTIHINGYTKPGRVELWNMVVTYGGVYKQYLEGKTDVTHIIASNLTKKKQEEFARYRIVKPEWIVDSIQAGKALPWTDAKYRVIDAGHNQHTLQLSESNGFQLQSTRLSRSYKPAAVLEHTEEMEAFVPDYPEVLSTHHPTNIVNAIQAESIAPQQIANDSAKFHEEEQLQIPQVNGDALKVEGVARTVQEVPAAKEVSNRPVTKTAKDPDFIQDYFRNSRLHHLSTWKANLRLKIDNIAKATATSSQRHLSPVQKYVMHVDFDCFFAAVSSRNRPELADLACAVTHGGSNSGEIASCNYKAREFGIKNGMWMKEAVKLCPDIISLPYEFEAYEAASDQFYQVLLDLNPSAIEAVSIDEALLNITNLLPSNNDMIQVQDVAENLADRVRKLIKERTGVAVSVGIGANVLQAKLAIKKAKPAGRYFVGPDSLMALLNEFDVASLPGVGHSTAKKLEENFEVKTVQQLRAISQARLQEVFGPKTGISLAQASNGLDETMVGEITQRKLVSIEINWGIRLDTPEEVADYMYRVSVELCRKLQDVGFASAQHLLVKVMRRSKTAPVDPPKFVGHGPCDKFNAGREIPLTGDASVVWKYALALLEGLNIPPNELRGIGVALTKLQSSTRTNLQAQRSMVKFLGGPTNQQESVRTTRDSAEVKNISSSRANEIEIHKTATLPMTQYIVPSQLDERVLAELPQELRDRILANKVKDVRLSDGNSLDIFHIPSVSQIDPKDFAALPVNLRHEILLHAKGPPRSPRGKFQSNTMSKYVVQTPSPKRKKSSGLLQTLTQGNFVTKPIARNLINTLIEVGEELKVSSSPSAEIDREVLAGLPEDLRKEVLRDDKNYKLNQRRRDEREQHRRARETAKESVPEEKYRRVLDLPVKQDPMPLGELGEESFSGLCAHLSEWYAECKNQEPEAEDLEDFRGYLRLLAEDKQDFDKLERLLRWLHVLLSREPDCNPVWFQIFDDLETQTNKILNGQGLGCLTLK